MTDTSEQSASRTPVARRLMLVLVVVACLTAVLVHVIGMHDALMVGGALAAIAVLAVVVWRLPHLRRHFARPGGARQRRSMPVRSSRRAGARSAGRSATRRPAGAGTRSRGRAAGGSPVNRRRPGFGRSPQFGPPRPTRRQRRQLTQSQPGGRPRNRLGIPRRPQTSRPGQPPQTRRQRRRAQQRPNVSKPGAQPRQVSKPRPRFLRWLPQRRRDRPPLSKSKQAAPPRRRIMLLVPPRLRRRVQPPAAPEAKPVTPTAKPKPKPAPAKPEGRPKLKLVAKDGERIDKPASTPATTGGNTMANPAEAVSEALQQHIGGYQPASGDELHLFFQRLPDMFREGGKAFTSAAERMTGEHIHPAVIDAMRELGGVFSGVGDHAEQVYSEHLAKHDLWLKS